MGKNTSFCDKHECVSAICLWMFSFHTGASLFSLSLSLSLPLYPSLFLILYKYMSLKGYYLQ